MRFEKKFLCELNRCYATTYIEIASEPTVLVATEGEGACKAFSGADFGRERTVWNGPGGTMSMVPIPGKDGEFLAIQKFFKLFQWEEAVISWVKPAPDGSFSYKEVLRMPYIHRFDLFHAGGKVHFLGCSLASRKDARDDWSFPGAVWVGELADDWDRPLQVRVLKDGLFRNHGYARSVWTDARGVRREAGLVTAAQGAFAILPPSGQGDDWTVEPFMDWEISDIAAIDIDGDGELEYATIEPWHGQYFRVYKKVAGAWKRLFEHPEVADFYHVVVAATLRGMPAFVGGCRRGSQHLFYVRDSGARADGLPVLESVTIENGVGPSNVAVFSQKDRDVIISANREIGQAALYFVTD